MVCGTCTFVAVAALAVCAAPAHAQLEPTLEAVRAQVRAAAGVRPANERIAVAVTRNGDPGTELRSRSGDDYRSDWAFGPFRNASGSIGGVTWEQNENGETIPDASDVAEPADEATVTKLTHEHDPADLYVISTLTVLGNGTKQYVDPATWRIVRSDAISPTGIRTTTFDDFRTTAGYTRAWHIAIGDGHEENDSTYTITNIDTSAISRTQLAVPASNRALVVFPLGKRRFRCRCVRTIEERNFTLDTGAVGAVLVTDYFPATVPICGCQRGCRARSGTDAAGSRRPVRCQSSQDCRTRAWWDAIHRL